MVQGTPSSDEIEKRKLEAEVAKLTAEASKLAAESNKIQAEANKLTAEVPKVAEETAKLKWENAHAQGGRRLEWFKSFGTSAAFLGGMAALLGFIYTTCTGIGQRADEAERRIDGEFSSALIGISEVDTSKRMVNVLNLARFLGKGYDKYHKRTVDVLVYRLRLEVDDGVRILIRRSVTQYGRAARNGLAEDVLKELRDQVRREIVPLFDRDPEPIDQIKTLQHAFLEASLSIAAISGKPVDLSKGRFKGFLFAHQDFSKGNFDETSLWYADLFRADLQGASLKNAILQKASLRKVRLSGADLQGATFECADLWQADFKGARNIPYDKMRKTNWREGLFDPAAMTELGKLYPGLQGTPEQRDQECGK